MPNKESTASTHLSGHTIVVTRASEQSGDLVAALRQTGATVFEMPLIAITEPADGGALRDATLKKIASYDWLVVTSPNGARRVAPFLANCSPTPQVAVIGEATQQALGVSASLVPSKSLPATPTGEGLVDEFPVGTGAVLVVQGENADPSVCEGIAAKGWRTTRVNAYRTVAVVPSAAECNQALAADAVVFASGSSVRSWVEACGPNFSGRVVVIGPVTKKVAESLGVRVDGVATEPNPQGIVDALAKLMGDCP